MRLHEVHQVGVPLHLSLGDGLFRTGTRCSIPNLLAGGRQGGGWRAGLCVSGVWEGGVGVGR